MLCCEHGLTNKFGKHNLTYKGEFFYYVWVLQFGEEVFEVCTANRKGTTITIREKNKEDKSMVCVEFLRKLDKILKDEKI